MIYLFFTVIQFCWQEILCLGAIANLGSGCAIETWGEFCWLRKSSDKKLKCCTNLWKCAKSWICRKMLVYIYCTSLYKLRQESSFTDGWRRKFYFCDPFNHYKFFWGDRFTSNMSYDWYKVMCCEYTITCLHSSQIQTILGTRRLARQPEKRIQARKGNKKFVVSMLMLPPPPFLHYTPTEYWDITHPG